MTTTDNRVTATREELLAALSRFINQRPGIDPANYGYGREGLRAYRAESRQVSKDRAQALELLGAVSWRESITAEDIFTACAGGRLTWDDKRREWDYCTGQYFATEYRKAACRLLASVLWAYWRENADAGGATGDTIRTSARLNVSRSVYSTYFR